MSRNDCEAVLNLHRTFRPRRRTGRGFLTGTLFLDVAFLVTAFTLATSSFVRKPGIVLTLPTATQTESIRITDLVLRITRDGMFFFNDELVTQQRLKSALNIAAEKQPDVALILEADQDIQQSTLTAIYDAAAQAGFRQIFIATQNTER